MAGKQRSLPGYLLVTRSLVEPQRGQVVATDVQPDGRFAGVAREILGRCEKAAGNPLALEIGGDNEAFDVCLG